MPGLLDAFKEAAICSKEHEATCESVSNSYTPSSLVKKYVKENIPGKRIDYIMYHPGSKLRVNLKNYELPLPTQVPGHHFSYSDHEAVEAILTITESKVDYVANNVDDMKLVLEKSLNILNKSLQSLVSHKVIYLFFAVFILALLLASIFIDLPLGYRLALNIIRVLLTLLFVFCFLMGFIWNKIEKHGIIATKLAIEVNLKEL